MKKIYLRITAAGFLIAGTAMMMSHGSEESITTYHHGVQLNSGGPSAARTGAPGESNCTSCHGGTAQSGAGVNTLALDGGGTDYTPGIANSMTLTLTDNSSKNGFQLVALDENEEMAGSFTISDAANTQLVSNTQLGRDYVTHTFSGTGESSWSFDWDAPSTAGDVTFYVATNKTNNAGNSSGDVIYLSSHTFSNPQLSVAEENGATMPYEVGYNVSKHALQIDFSVSSESEVTVNVIDLSGRSVYFNYEGKYQPGDFSALVRLPDSIENGIYNVTLFIGNTPYSAKIMVSK